MRYIVDVSSQDSAAINRLIEKQLYENLNQFVSTAITNQLLLEKSDIDSGNESVSKVQQTFIEKKCHDLNGYPSMDISVNLKVPDEIPGFVPLPDFSEMVPFNKGLDEGESWMWGQFNRIFPIKLALRVLMLKMEGREWIDFEQFRKDAADIALGCSEMISIKELEESRKREEKISAGLPKKVEGDKSPWDQLKSISRYKDHFIGSIRKNDGKLSGAMFYLKFANLKKNDRGKLLIGITEPGYEFGKLENPVIDARKFTQSLSQSDRIQYLSHIRSHVPGESNAIRWILEKIMSGIVDRPGLNTELQNEFGELWKATPAVINTQRAGLTARITELDLIAKEKDGIRVSYHVSEAGRSFLETFN